MYNNVVLLVSFYLLLMSYITAENIMHEGDVRNNGNVILSRKKRYLIFPDGTSLQLVYCFTIPIEGNPNIWTFGITASVAWLLPTKPEHVLEFAGKKTEERVDNDKTDKVDKLTTSLASYIDAVNKVAYKNKYTYPNYVSSYMPYYSQKDYYDSWKRPYYKQNERRIYSHNRNRYRNYTPETEKVVYKEHEYFKHPLYTELHRISRRDLYSKLENFFSAQRKDGKACLLKAICEVSKSVDDGRGTFTEEIIKTIFRNKPSHFEDEMDEFDHAANEKHNCNELYPTCTYS